MMPFHTVSAFAAIALLVTPALAQTPPEAAPTAAAKPVKPPKPRKICRSVDGANSRIASSVCKTAEEWDRDTIAGDGHIAGNNGH